MKIKTTRHELARRRQQLAAVGHTLHELSHRIVETDSAGQVVPRPPTLDHVPNLGIKVRHAIGRNETRIEKQFTGLKEYEQERLAKLAELAKTDENGDPIRVGGTYEFAVPMADVEAAIKEIQKANGWDAFMSEEIEFDVYVVQSAAMTDDCQYVYHLIDWMIAPDDDDE